MEDKATLQKVRVAFGDGSEGPSFEGYDLGGWNGFYVVALPFSELVRFYTAAAELGERDEEGRPVYRYELVAEDNGAVVLWSNENGPAMERNDLAPTMWIDGQPYYTTGGGWALVEFVGGAQ